MKKFILTLCALVMSLGLMSQSITITQPNGGELLYGCQTYTIKWNCTGVSNYWDIAYSLDGGTIWSSVASNLYITTKQYSWTVPMINSSTVYVRVRDHSDTTKQDRSDAYFTLQLPINISSPNGGEVWQGLSSHLITWTPAGTTGVFNISYSVDNGTNFTSVATNVAANNYMWSVPNNPSTTALVKVQDATTACQMDVSNAVFEISPATPILTAPNGGEVWTINSNRTITWDPATFYTSVKLEFSTDGGVNYNLITSSTANTGSYTWSIPNTPSSQVRVRISNATGSLVNDVSNANFTIQMPYNFLTSPNGGEVWRSMNTHTITWNSTMLSGNVKLEYSTNNGVQWNTIVASTSNNGSYSWVVPQIVTTYQALVRITSTTYTVIMDTSNAVFTIKGPVTVDYPDLGPSITGCSSINIQWSRTNNSQYDNYNQGNSPASYCGTYELYYSVAGGAYQMITSVSNVQAQTSYSYAWTVPDVAPQSLKIKIIAKYNTYNYGSPAPTFWTDSSDVASPVVNPSGTITVVNPNGGVTLNALTNYNVTWTASGSTGVYDVLYSVNGGLSYSSIATAITGLSYTWNVNNSPSTNVYVRVRDNANVCRKDASDAANTIVAATPILTSPNGGENWFVNNVMNITWTTATIFGNVMLEYSIDNGANWNIVTSSTANTGSYAWTVPNNITSQALIRITNVGYPTNYDVSNSVFQISLPKPVLTSPNGAEVWRAMNTQSITWNTATVTSNVKLEYSVNNGSAWNTIISSTSNTGSYSWVVPQIVSTTQALVRITSVLFPTACDTSNAVFTIKGPVTVDYPDLGPTITGCSSINIQWSRTNNAQYDNYNQGNSPASYCGTYELYYSVAGGPYQMITSVSNTQAQTSYSYAWTVPDVAPQSIKIKIIAKYNTYNYGSPAPTFWTDSSDLASPVVNPSGSITVVNPNGGVTLNALTNYNVTWTAIGSSGAFDILYSTNGGTSYNVITSNVNGNSYTWNVINAPSTNVYVRVRDNTNVCRKDASDAANTIIAATPMLTAPNGGEVWKVNSSQNITWNTASLYGPVLIEYSIDNGANWNIVAASASNTGSYAWTVPYTVTTQALIRISNAATPTNNDVSNAVFTINLPTPLLTSPNGGEVWRSMNTHSITWDQNTVASNVKIEYSTNNCATWNTIIASTSNTGSYSWVVPQMVTTTQARIRVTNVSFPTAMDTSNAVFTIKGPVTVDYPDLGPTITGCSSINIQWSRTTNSQYDNYNQGNSPASYCGTYELYYSVAGGPYQMITSVSNTQAQTSYSYAWTVPDVAPQSIKIKIIAKYNTYNFGSPAPTFWIDSSDVASPVVNPSGTITVINPNGGVTLNALTNYTVTWSASGTSGAYDILYSTNGGTSYSVITSNVNGTSYTWNVNNTPSTNVYVRVRDNTNVCRKDASDAANTIIAATPVLTAPNGGEVWKVNSSQNITWNVNSLYGPALIEYSTDNGANWNIVVASTSNTGSYAWTVPNTITTQALIRISNAATPTNSDVSNAVFTINLPTPLLTSPNGGEVWRSMNTHSITWDQNTVASNVKIEYSTNNCATWNTVIASTSNTGSYSWIVPQMVTTTQARIRVTNVSFPTAMDTSNAVFTIKGPVTVDYPDLGPTITGCSSVNIQWSRTNNSQYDNYNQGNSPASYCGTYELYYSVAGGAYQMITSVSNVQAQTSYSYAWTVPDVAPQSVKIKIIAKYNTYNYGSPAPTFWIDSSDVASPVVNPSGTITVVNPNGGVTLNALTNYNVTWTASGSSGYYDVLYSTNGGTSYSAITTNITGNSYTWNVNNTPSTNVYIRVRDNQNTCRKDASDAANTIIAATPILTSPNGGETWNVNSTQNITWNSATLFTNAYIEYSTDNGANWNIVTSSTSNSGSYSWTVPNIVTSQALIRISNVGYPSNYDVSNAVFNIVTPTNFVISPNGGEVWRSMNTQTITWTANAFSSPVKIEYSVNNGSSWSTIVSSTSNTGSYNWSVPQMLTTTQALVRVTNIAVPTILDASDNVFTIKAPVTVDYPDAGPNITGCSSVNIQWSRTNNSQYDNYNQGNSPASYCGTYELYYSVAGGAYQMITSVSNVQAQTSYSYAWTVPDVAPQTLKIKVIAKYNTYNYGSPAPTFWIDSSDVASPVVDPSGTIVVTNPNGNVTMNALTTYNVTWTANGSSGFYDILYSTNGGTSFSTVTTNVSGNTYAWTVNNAPSTNVFVKVRDNQNYCRKDISDAANTIVAATPILTAPNGGEVWNVNSVYAITWNSASLYGPVMLEYSIDNGATYNTIIASTSNTGTYNWTIPFAPSSQCLVRISNVNNPSLYDVSNAVFTILVPTPIILTPNGGETWYAGTVQNITWVVASYFSSTVNLEYSLNNGTSWTTIATNQPNNGTYAWTLPSLNSANALIRVSNYTNTSIYDVSNAILTLRPWVRVITPNGGDLLGSCTQTTISFERAPQYTSFNIEYSIDNGTNWTVIQSAGTYSSTFNNYSWTIPNTPSTQVLVRVYPVGQVALADKSDAVFTIKRAVTIIQPNYGGVLVIGQVYPVKWQSDGISNVYDIAYSTSGSGGTYTNIVLGYTTSLNTYNWTVPNTPTTTAFLRIRDNVNSCKEDISDLAFTISATPNPITLTAPNGQDTLRACQMYNITWTESGTPVGNYNLYYSIDYGTNWVPIVSNLITSTGNYNWLVPNINAPYALIKVQSGLNPLVFDYSNALFMIKPGKLVANNDTTICAGSPVQLHVTGGSSYTWTPSTGLSNPYIANPVATPSVSSQYIVTSVSGTCTLADTVMITVNPGSGLNASVSVSASPSTAVCSGTNVSFTATPTNGGLSASYQWKKNNVNVGTNTNVYSSSSLATGDVITCVMTSSVACVGSNPATSNAVTMTVYQNVTPSVSIAASQQTLCQGVPVTFTATPTNGGTSPQYQWIKNGNNVGNNTPTYLATGLANNDVVSVQMTSNASCASPLVVLSNSIMVTINPNSTPTVSISTPSQSVCSGASVTFTASVTNAGTPTYQWKVNNINAGTNSPTFTTTTLTNNASVTCVVTSSLTCNTVNPVTSNALVMTVTTAPSAPVASSNSPVTLNSTLYLYASTISGATYSWSGPNGFTSTLQNPSIPNATPTLNGTYSVTARIGTCTSTVATTIVTVTGGPGVVTISGRILSEIGSGVNTTKVKLTGTAVDSVTTPLAGTWQFSVNQGSPYVVTPSKINDITTYNGVSTLDIVLMQRHILNQQLLGSAYKVIAADVNSSGGVSTLDMVLTKSLILQNITSFPGTKLWAFVNSDFVFSNPMSPWPFEPTRTYPSVSAAIDQNFIGVKLGDVNNSWDPGTPKSISPVVIAFNAANEKGRTGDIVTVPVSVSSFNNISGFQYTVSWDPTVLEFVSAGDGSLDMDFGTLHTGSGNLTTLFSTEQLSGITLPDGSVIFEMQFRIIGQAGDVSAIAFNSHLTPEEAVASNLDLLTIQANDGLVTVENAAGLGTASDEAVESLQNIPNPFSESTDIIFTLAAASKVSIAIYDVIGNLVSHMEGDYAAGKHVITWDGRDSDGHKLSDGTYYCRLRSADRSSVLKMILIK